MSRRVWSILGVALLVGFAGFAFATFRTTLTPYVTFDDARAAGRVVQIAGALGQASTRYDESEAQLHFTLVDAETGGTMPVRYNGLRPANFEDAISIVAIGSWDATTSEFAATKLLVKCPSKYQGAEVAEVKTYG